MNPPELPVYDADRVPTRSPRDVRDMAVVIQANLVQLKLAAEKQRGDEGAVRGIHVASPGAVRRFRQALIPRDVLKNHTDIERVLHLHEVWGQYCMMCWVHETVGARPEVDFGTLPPNTPIRCETSLAAKHAEIHALLWRLRFEQRLRHDETLREDELFPHYESLAKRIPAEALGRPADECDDSSLLFACCQHAGMLATLRWVQDARRAWGDPDLTRVAELPF